VKFFWTLTNLNHRPTLVTLSAITTASLPAATIAIHPSILQLPFFRISPGTFHPIIWPPNQFFDLFYILFIFFFISSLPSIFLHSSFVIFYSIFHLYFVFFLLLLF